MTKQDINSRQDVSLLVHSFYERVREDELIGPVFNHIIHDWDTHLELLTDFWESNLLFQPKYKGNPHQVHQEVDQQMQGTISMEHFGRWLQLWFQTIDTLFKGKNAEAAKRRARNMSTYMFMKIYERRHNEKGQQE
ncbi:group III truncated hemoglobin [Algivirga pacifica]|uniref:Globin n=1 Tax=Algivirga pacifica TaxID=1162670 RepID=A0ABP9D4Z3_9BACT